MSAPLDDSLDALRDRLSKLGVDVDVDTVDTNTVPGVSSGNPASGGGGGGGSQEVCMHFHLSPSLSPSPMGPTLMKSLA